VGKAVACLYGQPNFTKIHNMRLGIRAYVHRTGSVVAIDGRSARASQQAEWNSRPTGWLWVRSLYGSTAVRGCAPCTVTDRSSSRLSVVGWT
jgi:hypothetical protein